jgi:hypothetical protein
MNTKFKNQLSSLLYSFVLLILFSSCSSNFLTGRKFNLDLVKVEKKQALKTSKTYPEFTKIEPAEILLASNEDPIVLNEKFEIELTEPSKLEKATFNPSPDLENFSDKSIKLSVVDTSKVKSNIEIPNDNKMVKTWDGFSIASFSISLLAILLLFTFPLLTIIDFVLIFFFFEILLAVTSIIFGAIGLKRTSKKKRKGRGFAIFGFCLGIAQLLYWIGITILVLILISALI